MMAPLVGALDHVVIAVRDLDAATARYAAHGFVVVPGGRHEGFGTRNALVPLGEAYLELLAVEDEERVAALGLLGESLLDVLGRADEALAGFAVMSPSVERARGALAGDDAMVGPLPMERAEAGGQTLRWRLLIPGGTPWRRPWPMLIEWDESAHPSSVREPHPNGATEVVGLTLEVDDLDAARRWYQQLGMAIDGDAVALDGARLTLRRSASSAQLGPGLSEVALAVGDGATRVLTAAGGADLRLEEAGR